MANQELKETVLEIVNKYKNADGAIDVEYIVLHLHKDELETALNTMSEQGFEPKTYLDRFTANQVTIIFNNYA